MFGELNKTSYKWKVDGKEFPFKTLEEIGEGAKFTMRGLFINSKGKYDPHPVAISDDAKIDLPPHLMETALKILNNEEMCEAVDNGKCGEEVYSYESRGKKCYSVKLIDL